ncbi:MAG TPA: tripartite tricarboxylate transporter substrate binding protein [Xanthobacteraceae bacterium]|nr:tripartite tricarboxylate transporter substrate binding protein [Xanthobacteraceae bacterium]
MRANILTIISRPLIMAACAIAAAAPAAAQDKFPVRPIRMLVPFAPGGGVDVVARIVGKRLGETLGQPILVESRPGGGGAVAVAELMRSAPDGYTLLMTTSAHATLPKLAHLAWHPSRDFSPIASIYSYMFVIATNAANRPRFATFAQFLDYARANPGKLNWGSSGIGGPQHLGGSQFVKLAGIDMVHVPYRGNAPMIQALLGDQVQIVFDTPTLVLPRVADGKLIALAVTGEQRLPSLPDVPTVRETGRVDYSYRGQIFVLGPKGMPATLQARLNAQIAGALEDAAARDQLTGFGLQVPSRADNTVTALTKHIDDFKKTYDKLIDEMGIEAQ